jgi:hypothetical protein
MKVLGDMAKLQVIGFLALAATQSVLPAQDEVGELDLTMMLLPEGARAQEAVTREIELPKTETSEVRASENGETSSEQGLGTANTARESARENGRAFGEAAAASAQDAIENLSRGQKPDLDELRPDPEIPEPPDVPEPP